jgi:disulfide bond formation protein DsbB
MTSETTKPVLWNMLFLCWLIAGVATLGSLFFSEVMDRVPCVLCWYQRIFMFPIAIILTIACFSEDRRGAVYAWALAAGGAVVAGYHTLLVAGWIPKSWLPCQAGISCADQKLDILNGLQIPWLALAAFLLILILLSLFLRTSLFSYSRQNLYGSFLPIRLSY